MNLKQTNMKQIKNMTWMEVQEEMSIAGNRDRMIEAAKAMEEALQIATDLGNPGDLINAELVLKRLAAEVKTWKRIYEERTGQKIG